MVGHLRPSLIKINVSAWRGSPSLFLKIFESIIFIRTGKEPQPRSPFVSMQKCKWS